MDFISLGEALDGIEGSAPAPVELAKHTDYAEERRYSNAAATLHQHLHNSPGHHPQWVELHKETGKPLHNDAVANEGMAVLEHMAGWYQRKGKERADHVSFCIAAGLDPSTEPMMTSPNGGQYDYRKQPFRRETQIGFDRDELVGFLSKSGVAHSLSGSAKAAHNDNFTPLGSAAAYLALKQWGDESQEESALSVLNHLNATAGAFTPVYALRVLTELEHQRNIDALVAANKVPLYSPITFTPTRTQEGALVCVAELAALLTGGAHLVDVEVVPVTSSRGAPNPWTIANKNDPECTQSWYIAARYFARELVKDDSTLLTKKNILAKKIAASLTNAGIFKRGGKLPIANSTILKALVKVTLS